MLDNEHNCVPGCSKFEYYSGKECNFNCQEDWYFYPINNTCVNNCSDNYEGDRDKKNV